jgi:type I restriction enzyme M protein
MLYASHFDGKKINFKNEIVKIENSYRETANVEDLFNRWNKFTKDNGIFEEWVAPYFFESKALRLANLKKIKHEDSSFIFNRFLEILRHNAVSDKPNAFNKIFTLFLCKIKDEDRAENDELDFQWREGEDDDVSFQKRLSDLYRAAMREFLEKEVADFSDEDFDRKYKNLEEETKTALKKEFTKLRLQKNNEFAIKEVFDEETFLENAKVIKEVVELLQNYKFRYEKKHPFLGDFFELLLTTGLKQEAGQFFTPVPVARFICKSVPLEKITREKLAKGTAKELLPNVLDYAAGSGHFITEAMEEIQNILNKIDSSEIGAKNARDSLSIWKIKQFDWALEYIYGIELDYRLVKTTKVGCYLHGDGIANVIHGDGLDSFSSGNYRGKLHRKSNDAENPVFDFILSNPPYSVSAFKGNLKSKKPNEDFELYKNLTDQSSEIECLFVERTAQLLKDGGVAAIILPSSLLNNGGIYARTREMILKKFEIVAIVEFGSGTFMATGTNTIVLFLRRRNNFDAINFAGSIENFFKNKFDFTLNGVENIFEKYAKKVWNLDFADFKTFLEKNPNENIKNHEIFREYEKKFSGKDFWEKVFETEKEKILFFVLAFPQKTLVVKSGDKKIEKEFLGYEFSFAKGREGIHPIRRGKTIDECTKLFDPESFENPEKVSTFVLDAFSGKHDREIPASLEKHIFRMNLVEMISFDRVNFQKAISTAVEKKKIESKWDLKKLGEVCEIKIGATPSRNNFEFWENGKNLWVSISEMKDAEIFDTKEKISDLGVEKSSVKLVKKGTMLLSFKLSIGKTAIAGKDLYTNEAIAALEIYPEFCDQISNEFLFVLFSNKIIDLEKSGFNTFGKSLNRTFLREEVKIPLPPLEIQNKIVTEISELEKTEKENVEKIAELKEKIEEIISEVSTEKTEKLEEVCEIDWGNTNLTKTIYKSSGEFPVFSATGNDGKADFFEQSGDAIIVSAIGARCGKCFWASEKWTAIKNTIIVREKKDRVLLKYLFQILNDENFWDKQGSAQPFISLGSAKNQKIPLPSLETQKNIVAKIENLEAEIAKLKSKNENFQILKKEILEKNL